MTELGSFHPLLVPFLPFVVSQLELFAFVDVEVGTFEPRYLVLSQRVWVRLEYLATFLKGLLHEIHDLVGRVAVEDILAH